jgi:hypothetical protein
VREHTPPASDGHRIGFGLGSGDSSRHIDRETVDILKGKGRKENDLVGDVIYKKCVWPEGNVPGRRWQLQ